MGQETREKLKTTVNTTKLGGSSYFPQDELIQRLKSDFPEVFAEEKVDFGKLKAALGENVDLGERYGLTWKGKSDVFRVIQETTTKTLKPAREESVNFDETDNLFIEGDNLEVLKVLQRAYYGKVKMIYIDPPYNTGSDFIYNDDRSQSIQEYEKEAGIRDENGYIKEDTRLRRNTKDGGHFHSNWLNMMYPRLYLARNLLRQDGVIFASIDDNEIHNLRMIMNEIFGEENFIAIFPWRKRTAKTDVPFGISQDYEWILAFTKGEFQAGRISERKYYHSDDYKEGWRLSDLTTQRSATERPNSFFNLVNPKDGKEYPANPNRVWGVTKNSFELYFKKGKIVFPGDYKFLNITKPAFRVFESEDKEKNLTNNGSEVNITAISTLLPLETGRTEEGTKELTNLMGGKMFPFPKPVSLIKFLINITNDKDSIVLDFFAGSGTAAQAVTQLNSEDGGNRKWVMVQLPEETEQNSEAQKAGYITIADIAKERIRRAGKKIAEENKDIKIDLGFKVFKLESTNFKIWDSSVKTPNELEQQMLSMFDVIRKDANEEDLLFELMLKSGIEPTTPRKKKEVASLPYWIIGDGKLIICLAKEITQELFDTILAEKPQKLIFLESALKSNDQLKTNLHLQAEKEALEISVV
jgi:adenine-specific DNA-methyltransferase